jgi:gluconolactonase
MATASPRVIAEGLGFTEGPVWTTDGRLLVTSISHGLIYEVGADETRVLAETQGGPNGMTEGKDAALYVTQNSGLYAMKERSAKPASPGIQVIEGNAVRYLAEGLDAPNDLCFGPDGRLYFTDPRGSVEVASRQPGRVFAMALDGAPQLLAEGPAYANGIAFGPDASQLYVAETLGQRVLVYPVSGDGLGEPREFCRIDPGFPDGMCFDAEGRLYVAATMAEEVQVFDAQGRCVDRLPCGEGSMPTNCCFGGPEGRTLFVTDSRGERVLAFELEAAGLPLFPFR